MNHRIQELAISTGIYDCLCDPYDKHNTGDPHGSVIGDLERFAELIIKECADVCQAVTSSGEFTGNQCYASAMCRDMVKKHFGVK